MGDKTGIQWTDATCGATFPGLESFGCCMKPRGHDGLHEIDLKGEGRDGFLKWIGMEGIPALRKAMRKSRG